MVLRKDKIYNIIRINIDIYKTNKIIYKIENFIYVCNNIYNCIFIHNYFKEEIERLIGSFLNKKFNEKYILLKNKNIVQGNYKIKINGFI